MNSSFIIFAFFIAGFLSVTVHDVFFGPIAYGPNNALHQVAKNYPKSQTANIQKPNAISLKQFATNQKN